MFESFHLVWAGIGENIWQRFWTNQYQFRNVVEPGQWGGGYLRASQRIYVCAYVHAKITIQETSFETFRSILKHIYSGCCEVNEENALKLLQASKLFCLEDLSQRIESFLLHAISISTATDIILAAVRYSLKQLEESCIEFIIDHYSAFVASGAFASLSDRPDILITLLERIQPRNRSASSGSVNSDTQ